METKRLIVADDVGVFPIELGEALVGQGYDIVPLGSGAEIYQRLAVDRPTLAIVGFQMPDLSGVEICRLVKENLSLKQLQIIIINTSPSPADRQQAFDAGCDGYFEAPLDIEGIFSRVVEVTGGSGPAHRPQTFSHLTVDYRSNAEVFTVFSADPIAGGHFFMRMRRPPPVGSTVHLRVTLQGRELVDTYAEIVRSNRQEGGRFGTEGGMELRIVDVDETALEFMRTLEDQKSFASDITDETSLDMMVQRIAEAVRTMGDEQTSDPILTRIGFSPHIIKPWEKSAFEALAVGGADQNDFFEIIRSVYGLATQIEFHLLNYRNLELLTEEARANLAATSNANTALATEVLQKVQEFSDRALRGGRLNDMNNLNVTRSALLDQNRLLRAAMTRLSQPSTTDANVAAAADGTPQVYSDPETKRLITGVASLFDFQSPTSSQSLASFLNIDFDLSGLSPWETAAFVEVKSRSKSLDPEFADWVRVLVALDLRVGDFIGKTAEKKFQSIAKHEETVTAALGLFERAETCVNLYRNAIVRILVRKSIPPERIRELVESGSRLLESANTLAELHDKLSANANPITHRARELSATIAAVLASPEGAVIGLEKFTRAGVADAATKTGKRKWARWSGSKKRHEGRFGAFQETRVKMMIGVLVLCGGILGFMLATNPEKVVRKDKVFKSVTVAELPAVIPVLAHPRPILMGEKLGVYASNDWLLKAKEERAADIKQFFEDVNRKYPVVARVAIYDTANKLRGYMERGQTAVAHD